MEEFGREVACRIRIVRALTAVVTCGRSLIMWRCAVLRSAARVRGARPGERPRGSGDPVPVVVDDGPPYAQGDADDRHHRASLALLQRGSLICRESRCQRTQGQPSDHAEIEGAA